MAFREIKGDKRHRKDGSMSKDFEVPQINTDVLIIGGGTAGCYAALTLSRDTGLSVVIAEKAHIKRSGCLAAGVNAINAYITKGACSTGLCRLCQERCRRYCQRGSAAYRSGAFQ